jgi:hypothetical protein
MLEEVQRELSKFGRAVIKQSRSNLTRLNRNDTKDLYSSLDFDLKVHKNSFSFSFYMMEYGAFVDEGVRGANPSAVKNGKQKGGNSPYRFKNKRPPMQPLADWAKRKNIRLRTKDGKFAKGNYKSIGFILQKRIWAQGMKPTLFFTKPFEQAFSKLPDEILEKFGLDIDEFIEQTLNN